MIKFLGPEFASRLSSFTFDADNNPGPKILCLSRESFSKDISELRKRTDYSYISISGGFTRFQMAWTPKEMQIQTFYQSYEGLEKNDATEKSVRYALRLIELAGRKKKISAVLSANFDYWQDNGFKVACKQLGIPFIVLSREHLVIPFACDEVRDWYIKSNYKFTGAAIAVAGQSTKLLLDSIETICCKNKVLVTGFPRLDSWLDIRKKNPINDRTTIALLTFSKGYLADNTFKEVLQLFFEVAKSCKNKKIKFIIKTKDINDNKYIKNLLPNQKITSNLLISDEINLVDFLPDCRMVINYNSLSLVEAAIAKSIIVIPAWGECKDEGENTMYSKRNPRVSRVVNFAYSPTKLKEFIIEGIFSPKTIADCKDYEDFVEEFFYRPSQGSSSQEIVSIFKKYINKK
jgi:hypothetical protein